MKVLVTRAEPAAGRTANSLRDLGHEPVLLLLTELVDTGALLPSEPFDGFIFTSANALRILNVRDWQTKDATLPAFCVGQKTADAAERLGFQNLVVADGGGAKLAEEIKVYPFKPGPRLVYPTTPDRQFDMQSALAAYGMSVEHCEIYQMQALEIHENIAREALHSVADGAILVYSTESAKMLLKIIIENSMAETLQKTAIITISIEAAMPFESAMFQNIYISDVPNEISMFHILDKLDL